MGVMVMGNRERKRLRKGVSIASLIPFHCEGIATHNLKSAIEEAKTLSLTLARSRPGEAAWVYRFSVPDSPVIWVGVRFSEEPESGHILDGERLIRIDPIIGYLNGQRISPECTRVHSFRPFQTEAEKKIGEANLWYSNELVERWKAFFVKKYSRD